MADTNHSTNITDLGNGTTPGEGLLPPDVPDSPHIRPPIPQGEQNQGPVPPPPIPQPQPQPHHQPQLVQNVMNDYDKLNGQQIYYDENNQPFIVQEMPPQQDPTDWKNELLKMLKLPAVVAILVYLASDGTLNSVLTKVPKLGSSVGTLNLLGKLFQAVLFAGVFYLVQRFL